MELQKHVAVEGERLDQIHYLYYETMEGFEQLLEANRHLLRKPILDTGDIVYLPVLVLDDEEEKGSEPWAT